MPYSESSQARPLWSTCLTKISSSNYPQNILSSENFYTKFKTFLNESILYLGKKNKQEGQKQQQKFISSTRNCILDATVCIGLDSIAVTLGKRGSLHDLYL